MRVVGYHRSGGRFDEIGEMGVRKPPAQGCHGGRGEDHIADLPQAHQQNLQ